MLHYDPTGGSLMAFYTSPTMLGVVYVMAVLLLFSVVFSYLPRSSFTLLLDLLYEKVFSFYESILGKDAPSSTKTFIVTLFFIILITNILGVVLDFIAPIFGTSGGAFLLSNIIQIPSSDLQFNIALALVSIILLIVLQFGSLGGKSFFLTYFPIYGKGYLEVEKGSMNTAVYYILFPVVKFFDIVISFFLAFLDLIGLVAKVVSLSFRLFGNIVSGGVLLGMLIVALGGFTETMTSFIGGINFPVIVPLALYAQSLLVAVIQAMVFPLLVAIFIKVSQLEG